MRATVPVALVPSDSPTEEDVEEALLAVDPDDVLAAVIAMPLSIPAPLRTMITDAACEFDDDDLDAWLHSPSIALGGETPFERVALGDGEAPNTNARQARKRTATPRAHTR